jgi:LysM repeat protein
MRAIFVVLLTLWVPLALAETRSPESNDPGRRHALVIGMGSAAADAQAVAEVLRQNYRYLDVSVLLDKQATRRAMLKALADYMALGEEDSLLIYYAGESFVDNIGNGFWVPPEAAPGEIADCLAHSQVVEDYLRKYRVRHLLVLADSAFGDPLPLGGGKRADKASRELLISGGGPGPFGECVLQYLINGRPDVFGTRELYACLRQQAGLERTRYVSLVTPGPEPGEEYAFRRLTRWSPPMNRTADGETTGNPGGSRLTAGQYEVVPGDTLDYIGLRLGIPTSELVKANNGVNRRSLKVGEKLVVPPHPAVRPRHLVAPGETLKDIAMMYTVPVSVLMKANHMTSEDVAPGQALIIPPPQ